LPRYLPEYIEVDLLKMQLGESLHLSELSVPEGVKMVALTHGAHADTTVVMVYKPRAAEEEAPVAGPAEGDAAAAAATPAAGAEGDKGKGDKG
jgi:large subunit ribosomal protein L25